LAAPKTRPNAKRAKRKDANSANKHGAAQAELEKITAEADEIHRVIPNMSHPSAPIGTDDQANLEIKHGIHKPRKFDFQPLDHVQLGQNLKMIDLESGAKVAGHGFTFSKTTRCCSNLRCSSTPLLN